jgi:hypothetical protein
VRQLLDDVSQQGAVVDAGALQGVDREDQVEAAEVEGGEGVEVCEVGGDEAGVGAGEAGAGDGEGGAAVIDADQLAAAGQPRDQGGEQGEGVAAIDPELEHPRRRVQADALDRVGEVEDEVGVLELGDPGEAEQAPYFSRGSGAAAVCQSAAGSSRSRRSSMRGGVVVRGVRSRMPRRSARSTQTRSGRWMCATPAIVTRSPAWRPRPWSGSSTSRRTMLAPAARRCFTCATISRSGRS